MYTRNFWRIEGRPNRGRSRPHWLPLMIQTKVENYGTLVESSLLAFIRQSLVSSARPLAVLSRDCFIQHLLFCKEQAFKAFKPGFAEMQWLDDLVGGLQATFSIPLCCVMGRTCAQENCYNSCAHCLCYKPD